MRLTTATRRAFEFGCQSAACAPPNRKGTGGTGGSIKGKAFDRRSKNPKLAPWLPVTGSKPPPGAPVGRGQGAYSNESPRTIFQPPTRRGRKVKVSVAVAAAFHKIKAKATSTGLKLPNPNPPRRRPVMIAGYRR